MQVLTSSPPSMRRFASVIESVKNKRPNMSPILTVPLVIVDVVSRECTWWNVHLASLAKFLGNINSIVGIELLHGNNSLSAN